MKTLLIKLQVLLFIFLSHFLLKAQNEELYPYRGGNADGFATENLENNSCPTPYNLVAYFGGNGDGAGTDILADNSCGTPFNQFSYFGGTADGEANETIMPNNCATPFHFYAYFSGNGDGGSMDKTIDTCPISAPVADFIASETTTCVGKSVLFTDTSTNKPTGWTWTFEGGTPGTASTKTVNVTYSTPGIYQVKLVAANYIGSDTKIKQGYITVLADCSTLGSAGLSKAKIQIYPNPTKDLIYLKSPNDILTIEVFDSSGRKVMDAKPNRKDSTVNMEKLNAGLYLLKTSTQEGEQVYKVIKKD